MSEDLGKAEENKEDFERLVMETIDRWKQKLPAVIRGWQMDESNTASLEEIFAQIDEDMEIMKANKEIEEWWKARVEKKLRPETNNFRNLFSAEAASMLLDGKMGHYGIRPFYINARFNGAWSRMCEQFSNEVRKIIKMNSGKSDISFDEEKNICRGLALYLNEKEGVLMTFLCQ